MTDDLLPKLEACPMCGGKAALHKPRLSEDCMGAFVRCGQCRLQTDLFEDAYTPSAEAIAAWNTRPKPTLGDEQCHLCAGKCRGHRLGHPEEWEPEPGSQAALAASHIPDSELPTEIADKLDAWLRNLDLELSGASLNQLESMAIGGAVLTFSDLREVLRWVSQRFPTAAASA